MERGEKEKREQEQLLRALQQQAQQRKQQMESIITRGVEVSILALSNLVLYCLYPLDHRI